MPRMGVRGTFAYLEAEEVEAYVKYNTFGRTEEDGRRGLFQEDESLSMTPNRMSGCARRAGD